MLAVTSDSLRSIHEQNLHFQISHLSEDDGFTRRIAIFEFNYWWAASQWIDTHSTPSYPMLSLGMF